MTDVIQTSGDWLALREPEDARSRSIELALASAELLNATPIVVHDLGSGTGSMMRWLAPMLPGPQSWVLHDWNAGLVDTALEQRMPDDRHGRAITARSHIGELDGIAAGDLRGASLVTASALLDVLSSQEVHAIAAACVTTGVPVLLSLSVTGRVRLAPRHPLDGTVLTAFNAHQMRSAEGRVLLGPHAVAVARGLFLEAGWHVRPVETPWRLGPHDPALLAEWFDGWTGAAFEQDADLHDRAEEYLALRHGQLRDGQLTAVVEHRDLLAWPR